MPWMYIGRSIQDIPAIDAVSALRKFYVSYHDMHLKLENIFCLRTRNSCEESSKGYGILIENMLEQAGR